MPELRSPFSEAFRRDDSLRLAAALKVIADPRRLQIIHFLHTRGELHLTELVELLGMAQSGVTRHVHVLMSAGLVGKACPGRTAPLVLRSRRLAELVLLLGGGS
jgi:ArsR family transcriptional regulator